MKMKSRSCMPNLTPMVPKTFITARRFPTIDRCGDILESEELYRKEGKQLFRNIEKEEYKYSFPKETDGIASFAEKVTKKPFSDRFSVDEIDLMIREKLSKERFMIKELFNSSSDYKNGYITMESFMKILCMVCQNIKVDQFYKLLERYDLNQKAVISFEDFEKTFAVKPTGKFDAPVIFHGMGNPFRVTSSFAMQLLREAAMDKDFKLKEILPPSCFEGAKIILMPQFREALLRVKIDMCDEDFIRLWNRMDINGVGSIPLIKLLTILNLQDDGTPMCGERDTYAPDKRPKKTKMERAKCPLKYTNCYTLMNKAQQPDIKAGGISFPLLHRYSWKPHGPGGTNEYPFGYGSQFSEGLDFLRERRPKFASIMDTLSYIFEEPYQAMKITFERYDRKKTGFVTLCDGLKILCEYDFNIELDNLMKFLSDQGCYDVNNGMNYRKLLTQFMNKETGSHASRAISQIIIAQSQASGLKSLNTMSVEEIEQMLYKILHKDYIHFQTMLEKCSPDSKLILEKNMRNIIEKILGFKMSEEQWEALQDEFDYDFEIGDDDNRLVNFRSFLQKFNKPKGICRYRTDPKLSEKSDLWNKKYIRGTEVYDPARDSAFICRMVCDTLKQRFHQIDKQYKSFADSSTSKLSKETLFELLNNQNCKLTPQEMDVIWYVVERHPHYSNLHYRQILKHLMANLYKRAKEFPIEARIEKLKAMPDQNLQVLAEFKKAQKKEKEERVLQNKHKIAMAMKQKRFEPNEKLKDETINKMTEHMKTIWKVFKKQIRKKDVMGTTTLELFEMKDLLNKNDFVISNEEMANLLYSFDKKRNGRFHYIDFLMEFTKNAPINNNKSIPIKFDRIQHNLLNKKTGKNITITETYKEIRNMLIKKWKSLIRAFRKLDVERTGRLSKKQLNSILLQSGIELSQDDLFHFFTGFDTDLDGTIDYIEFIEQLLDVFLPNPV